MSSKPSNLGNRQVIGLLSTLSPSEKKRFRKFLQVKSMTKTSPLVRLEQLLDEIGSAEPEDENPETLYARLYPGKPFSKDHFNKVLFDLKKLLEEFLRWNRIRQSPGWGGYLGLMDLRDRGLKTHFDRAAQSFQKSYLSNRGAEDSEKALIRFLFERDRLPEQETKKQEAKYQASINALDAWYLVERLKLACQSHTFDQIHGTDHDASFFKRFEGEEAPAQEYQPLVQIYVQIYQMLLSGSEADYFEVKRLVLDAEAGIARIELVAIYQYLFNYCTSKINLGKQGFLVELEKLYSDGLAKNLLSEKGGLNSRNFKNIITVYLRLKAFDRAEQFIELHGNKIVDDPARITPIYNRAMVHFHRSNFSQARNELLQYFHSAEGTKDVFYQMDARANLCRCFFELKEFDLLEAECDSFRMFVHRNKRLTPAHKSDFRNFLYFLRKLRQVVQGDQRRKMTRAAKLRAKLEELGGISYVDWILEKIEENAPANSSQ